VKISPQRKGIRRGKSYDTKIIFSGFGESVMLMGKYSRSGMFEKKYVTWLPSYGPEMRGGTANCTVIVSDKPIGAPVTDVTTEVFAMNIPSIVKFEPTLQKDGLLFINTSMGEAEIKRKDIKVVKLPIYDIADKINNLWSANLVATGHLRLKQIS
jgi:2-oxoglutarate ferredoxin oxidoreductase subunit gamma